MPYTNKVRIPCPCYVLLANDNASVAIDQVEYGISDGADATLYRGDDLACSSIVLLYLKVKIVPRGVIEVRRAPEGEIGRHGVGAGGAATSGVLNITAITYCPEVWLTASAIVCTGEEHGEVGVSLPDLGLVNGDLGEIGVEERCGGSARRGTKRGGGTRRRAGAYRCRRASRSCRHGIFPKEKGDTEVT